MIVFIKPDQQIYCKDCEKPMDEYTLGLPLNQHQCTNCISTELADALIKNVKEQLNND